MKHLKTLENILTDVSFKSNYDKKSFIIKCILASLIAAFSLETNNQEGLLASVLISPFGKLIILLLVSIFLKKIKYIKQSIIYIILSLIIMIGSGIAVSKHFNNEEITEEMNKNHSKPDKNTILFSLITGFGIGMIYISKDKLDMEKVGLAIGIAILPPIVNYGNLYTRYNLDKNTKKQYMENSLNTALYNIYGILISCVLLFMFI